MTNKTKPEMELEIKEMKKENQFWQYTTILLLTLLILCAIIFIGRMNNLNEEIKIQYTRIGLYQESLKDCYDKRGYCVNDVEIPETCIYTPIDNLSNEK